MHAVRHVADWHFVLRPARKERLEKTATHVPMQSADAVGRAASAQSEISHVELLLLIVGMLASKRQQVAHTEVHIFGEECEVLRNQFWRETVEPRGYGRVRCENITSAGCCECCFKRLSCLLHETAGSFKHRKGRVPLVEMTNFRTIAQFTQQPPAADAQKDLLEQSGLQPTSIEFTRNRAMKWRVGWIVAVQQ